MQLPDFKASAEARLLASALRKVGVGEVITYGQITELISMPKEKISTPLRTALKRALKDDGLVFDCIRNVGFQRLNDAEIIEQGTVHASRLRRRALASIERQTKADFSKLSRTQQAKASAQISVMAAVAMMSKEKSIEKLADSIDPEIRELPTAKTLAMFSSSK